MRTLTPYPPLFASFADQEEYELRGLCDQAFDLRAEPYFLDAIQAIEEWVDRRALRCREHRDARHAFVLAAIRETNAAVAKEAQKAA